MTSNGYRDSKDLWSKISATLVRISSEKVAHELKESENQLLDGLLVFRDTSHGKNNVKDKGDSIYGDLVHIVSHVLNLNKKMAQIVLNNYLMSDFRGAGETIKNYLESPEKKKKLIEDIFLGFCREQLFLLQCIKLIWTYSKLSENTQHPYQENFKSFVGDLSLRTVVFKLIEQIQFLTSKQVPKSCADLEMTENLCEEWYKFKLWGQILLAQILLEVTSTFKFQDATSIFQIFNTYKETDFGFNVGLPRHLSANFSELVNFLSVCQTTVLVQLIDSMHVDLQSSAELKAATELNNSVDLLENRKFQGLLMIAYDLLSNKSKPPKLDLIKKAMQVNQFCNLIQLLQQVKNMNDPAVEDRIFVVMMTLLSKLLETVNVNVAHEGVMVYQTVALILTNKMCSNIFWENPQGPLRNLLKYATDCFPYLKFPLMCLITSLSKSDLKYRSEVLDIINNLKHFTQIANSETMAGSKCTLNNELKLTVDKAVLGGEITLRKGTIGVFSKLDSQKALLHWQTHYNFWDVLKAEEKFMVESIKKGLYWSHPHCKTTLECILAVLEAGNHQENLLTGAVYEAMMLAQCFCRLPAPPLDILAILMKMFTALVKLQCASTCQSVSSIRLIPDCRHFYGTAPSLSSKVDYGVFDFVVTLYECDTGKCELVLAYINFLQEIIKYQGVPLNVVVAGIITVNECIFPSHSRWQYKNPSDKDEIGLACVKFAMALLNPIFDSHKTKTWKQLCIDSLFMYDASPALLDIAIYGERHLESAMLFQSTQFAGRGMIVRQKIQLGISILNMLLQMKDYIANGSSTCYLLEHLKTYHQYHPNNVYSRLANYLYSKFFPNITTLAIRVLQQIFDIIPMSLHSYMGESDDTIHHIFALRLLAEDESPPLRTAIIDLITTCIKTGTQSRLLEVLFCPPTDTKDKSEKEELPPILDFLLGVMCSAGQDPMKVQNGIYQSVIKLMTTSWAQPNNFLRNMLKPTKDFWKNLFTPLQNDLLDSPVYPSILNLICLEIARKEEVPELDVELKEFLKNSCVQWNQQILDEVLESINSDVELLESKKQLLDGWSIFLVLLVKQKSKLFPSDTVKSLCSTFLDTLLKSLNIKFDSPYVATLGQIFLHLLYLAKDSDLEDTFTSNISSLLESLTSKYVYLQADSRTILLAVVAKAMECKAFSAEEACQPFQSRVIPCFGEMMVGELVHIPRLTTGQRPPPMLYCCLLRFLNLCKPYGSTINVMGAANIFNSIIKHTSQLLKERLDLTGAEIAMKVLVTASDIPALVPHIVISELDELFVALTSCKYNVSGRDGDDWDEVYGQGLVLCTNLLKNHTALSVKLVLRFVYEHKSYLLSLLQILPNRQDRRGLKMILHTTKLFSVVCEYKSIWQYEMGESLGDIMQSILICVDLCIVFVTRPKMSISSSPKSNQRSEEFLYPAEKSNLLLQIASESLDCLCKITSPDKTNLQDFTQLPDSRLQTMVIQNILTPSPSLANNYRPALSFGHLTSLCNYCVQLFTQDHAERTSTPNKELGAGEQTNLNITKQTLDRCLLFIFLQAKAHIQGATDNPAAVASFRKELINDIEYLLGSIKRKSHVSPIKKSRPSLETGSLLSSQFT